MPFRRRNRHIATDRTLWQWACEQDSDAFGILFERHAKRVYNHCFRRTSNWAMAEDLTSVVFMEAWRKRDDVVITTDSVLPWLLAVANNVCRNSLRSLHRYHAAISRVQVAEAFPIDDDVLSRVDAEQQMKLLNSKLAQLNDGERDVLALCVWEGIDQVSAAEALDISVGTVKSRLSRARARLRRLSDDSEPEPLGGHKQLKKRDGRKGEGEGR